MHLPYVAVLHVAHPNVRKIVHKVFWEVLPKNVDRTHTYGCITVVGSKGMH